MKYYHVTAKRRLSNIKKHGLLTTHRKNVPISKPRTIYLFKDKLEAGYFASEMDWKREEPVAILTVKVNPAHVKQDMNTRAIVGSWFYTIKDIKPSQIIKIENFDKKFIHEHRRRMARQIGKRQHMVVR